MTLGELEYSKWFYGGIGLTSIAILAELSSRDNFDSALLITLYSFAVSIPSATFLVNFQTNPKTEKPIPENCAFALLAIICVLSFLIGMISLFFHFSTGIGFVSIVSSIVAMILTSWKTKD